MKTFTIEDIRSWKPCYPPEEKLPEGWIGTALDILGMPDVFPEDKFWVVLREDVLSEKTLRLFAVRAAREVQHLMRDGRSLKALNVAEAFAYGRATEDELRAARDAAWDAASAAAWAAAWDAARYAANDAAWDAASAAARYAASAAANDAAWDAAWDAAREKQVEILVSLINEFEV